MGQAIIEKIKKLLALATSSSEHEARLAAEKANELLIRHNLKMQDLGEAEASYEKITAFMAPRYRQHTAWIISILQKFFFVVAVRSRYIDWDFRRYCVRLHLVGEESNVQVGYYVFGFLDREFPKLWRQFHETNRRSRAVNYYRGLHDGLCAQLDAGKKAVENDTGLVVVKDPNLPAAVTRLLGKTTGGGTDKYRARFSRAYAAGHTAGENLKIRQGITERGDGPVRQIEGKA